MSEHMKDHEAWAEFGDVLRLPINPETDYVGGIPWEGAGFKPELPLVDIGPGSGLTTVALAEQFLRHPGQVLSREQLLSSVWGLDFDPGSNVVDVYVRYLRGKLGPDHIVTVRGAGYRWE